MELFYFPYITAPKPMPFPSGVAQTSLLAARPTPIDIRRVRELLQKYSTKAYNSTLLYSTLLS